MNKLELAIFTLIFALVLTGCAVDPQAATATVEACQIDPDTGMCKTNPPDYERQVREEAARDNDIIVVCTTDPTHVCCTIIDERGRGGTICAGEGGIVFIPAP